MFTKKKLIKPNITDANGKTYKTPEFMELSCQILFRSHTICVPLKKTSIYVVDKLVVWNSLRWTFECLLCEHVCIG